MRILLLQSPVSSLSAHAHLSPPLGLAYVAAALLAEGHDVEIVDLNITGFNPARVEVLLDRVDPQLVGISAHTEAYPNALALAGVAKRWNPRLPVVLGGPHASILPLEVLAEAAVDFVAVGEGERTAVELAAALGDGGRGVGAIAGLGHKALDRPALNAPRAPLDSAEIGVPARHLLSLEFYADAHNVLVARGGCPYRCPFCSASHLWGGRRRMRPVDHIVAEVEHVVREYGARHVFFVDDILTLDRRWLDGLMDALTPLTASGLRWGCATRVDRVDPPLLARMAEAGCSAIQFGIESGAQSILDSVKGIDKGTALEAVEATVAAGMAASCSFMVPFPEDTEETLAETLSFMRRLRDAGGRLLISYTTPFPGTMFHDRAEELGLTILTRDYGLYDAKHVVLETRHLSASRIAEVAGGMAEALGMIRTEGAAA